MDAEHFDRLCRFTAQRSRREWFRAIAGTLIAALTVRTSVSASQLGGRSSSGHPAQIPANVHKNPWRVRRSVPTMASHRTGNSTAARNPDVVNQMPSVVTISAARRRQMSALSAVVRPFQRASLDSNVEPPATACWCLLPTPSPPSPPASTIAAPAREHRPIASGREARTSLASLTFLILSQPSQRWKTYHGWKPRGNSTPSTAACIPMRNTSFRARR